MTQPWHPDHPVDQALACELVYHQFPDLAGCEPQHVGRGWDGDVWRFGEWVFRFPRRRIAVAFIASELAVLPALAPRLPVRVPLPERRGTPTASYPAPWYGHRFLPGLTGDRAHLDAAGRLALVPALAGFLRSLHDIPPAEALALGAPADTFRGDVPASAGRGLERLGLLEGTPWAPWLAPARALLESPPPARVGGEDRLLHGDLYARHLLLDQPGHLAGVIDWGDVCRGDVALDLSIAFTFLPPEARPAFWAAYGPVDAETQARARVIGLARYGINLLAYARDVQDADLEAEAGQALRHALA